MALNIGEIMVRLSANTADFTRGITTAKTSMNSLSNSVKSSALGAAISVGAITMAAVALGKTAVTSSMSFNKAMANIGTLIPGNQKRLQELKKDIMDAAKEFGLLPSIMAEGVYQTISAYGDSADTMRRTRLAAEFATAGVMSVATATDLLSAATMGYGDISLKAMKRTADMAFIAAKGKVTPEQLASAMPMVVPVAAELGIKQDELFAAMGTLSGVSGATANIVATQLSALSRAFLNPTEDMKMVLAELSDRLIEQEKIAGPLVDRYKSITKQMDAMRLQYSQASLTDAPKFAKRLEELKKASLEAAGGLGKSIVSSLGLQETLKSLAEITGGNSSKMSDLLGRVEGYAAASQLAGAQSDRYKEALQEMNTEGLTPLTDALREQTDGINAAGFKWEQFKTRVSTSVISLGDKIAPVLTNILDWLEDQDSFLNQAWATWNRFGKKSEEVGKNVKQWFVNLWPELGASASNGWEQAKSGFESFFESYAAWARSFNDKVIFNPWEGIKNSAANAWEYVRGGFSPFWTSVTTFFKNTWTYITDQMWTDLWGGIKNSASGGWEYTRPGWSNWWTSVATFFKNTWTYITSQMWLDLWIGIKESASNAWGSMWSGFDNLKTKISDWFRDLASNGYAWGVNLWQRFWEGLKSWITGGSGSGSGGTIYPPVPAMAAGGIVTSPTLAMVGEAGPEAVIPLNRLGGSGGNYITINVNGSGNPDSVADAIVQRLKLKGIRVV